VNTPGLQPESRGETRNKIPECQVIAIGADPTADWRFHSNAGVWDGADGALRREIGFNKINYAGGMRLTKENIEGE
jgi:hypothetical protein